MNIWLKIALFASLPALSHAHTMSPYVLPEVFDVQSNNISFQSGITVEKFYVPTSNFKTSYVVTDPSGKETSINAAASLKRFNVGEIDIPADGTYRIRTQDAMGNPGKYALVDGRWLRVRPARPANAPANPKADEKKPATAANVAPKSANPPRFIAADQLPANAEIMDVKNHFIAETYVTKNKPSAIPKVSNKGFEVKLDSHPNQLFAGDTFKGQVLFNGKPVSGLEVDVFKGASSYQPSANREQPHVKTNNKGEFSVEFKEPGLYLISTTYPEPNPDNTNKPASDSYTYSLSVEVTE